MKDIREYIENLFDGVPKSERREQIIEEIVLNMEEKVEDLMARGKEREDAVNKALIDFGSIDDLKAELKTGGKIRRVHTPGLTFGFAACGSLLLIASLAFLNSQFFPEYLWSVLPSLGILWWPLATLFRWLKIRAANKRRNK